MSLFDAYSRFKVCSQDGHLKERVGETNMFMCENDCCYCTECIELGKDD